VAGSEIFTDYLHMATKMHRGIPDMPTLPSLANKSPEDQRKLVMEYRRGEQAAALTELYRTTRLYSFLRPAPGSRSRPTHLVRGHRHDVRCGGGPDVWKIRKPRPTTTSWRPSSSARSRPRPVCEPKTRLLRTGW